MSQNMDSTLNAYRPNVGVNDVLPHMEATGCIKEYKPVGDGVHVPHQQLSLLPLIERTRTRPQTLVRKVTVVGSHILRYVSRNNNFSMRRHQRQSFQRTRLTRIDPFMNYGSTYNYDQEDVFWLTNTSQPLIASPRLMESQPESGSQHLMLQANPENSSLLSWFNWKIYLGMICIIVAQALLKLSFQGMFKAS